MSEDFKTAFNAFVKNFHKWAMEIRNSRTSEPPRPDEISEAQKN